MYETTEGNLPALSCCVNTVNVLLTRFKKLINFIRKNTRSTIKNVVKRLKLRLNIFLIVSKTEMTLEAYV